MNLVLTLDALLETFTRYNTAIWPMQVVAYLLGILALVAVLACTRDCSRLVAAVLAFLWLWTGVGFFLVYFAKVYTPAYLFGGLFIVQELLFLAGVFRPHLSFRFRINAWSLTGLIMIAYAMLGYPLVGYLIGHVYPQMPPFGLTPCPLAVFTFGLYLMTDRKVGWGLLVIPLLWALGGVMPVSVGILEDIGLIASGVIATVLLVVRDRKKAA